MALNDEAKPVLRGAVRSLEALDVEAVSGKVETASDALSEVLYWMRTALDLIEDAERRLVRDKEVSEYRLATLTAMGERVIAPWDDIEEVNKEGWRKRFYAAENFFKKNVVNMQDPEPEMDSKWRSATGKLWIAHYAMGIPTGWCVDTKPYLAYTWSQIAREEFPMKREA